MDDLVAQRIDHVQRVHRGLVDSAPMPIGSGDLKAEHSSFRLRKPQGELTIPLSTALQVRRTRYEFGPLDGADLSSLLRWALGAQRTATAARGRQRVLTMYPCAGGLHSLRAYVVVLQPVDDIPVGVHRYDHIAHRLLLCRSGAVQGALGSSLVQPEFAERAPVVIVLVGQLETVLAKYSHRHYRTLHVDAGIAAQNLYLVATALDLAGCAISGFYDDNIDEFLLLDNDEIALMGFAVGSRPEFGEQR